MAKKQVTKGKGLYRNGLSLPQPEYTEAKLKDDMALLEALNAAFAGVEGQDYACRAVKEQLFGISGRANGSGPAALFLFAGPPAVGKTMLAQKIGEALGRPFERFDMSGYSDKEAPISLFGLNESYKAAAPGRFTRYIKEHPVSVILLDEIEKAHVTVRNNILQMLDRGTVYDLYYEKEFSVRDCILIFTSNVGADAYNTGDKYNLSTTPVSTVIKALEDGKDPATGEPYFSRELVSRFASGRVIVFNRLRPEVLHRIAVRQLDELAASYLKEYNISVQFDRDILADVLIFSQGGDADARSVIRAVKEFFGKNFERIAEEAGSAGCGGRICSIRYKTDFSSAAEGAAEVLAEDGTARVFTYGGSIAGSLPAKLKKRAEIVCARGGEDVHFIKKLDPAIALLGVTSKNGAEAKRLFGELAAAGVPAYVYTKEGVPLTYYAENGAVDCFTPRRAIDFGEWLAGAVRGINMSKAAARLFRSNKVITFSASYKYSARTCAAEVTLHGFDTRIAYGGGEQSLFAGRGAIPDVTFDSIIGAEEAKRELLPIIRQLKDYHKYKSAGIRIPRGIILDGPPGCGKTTIAKAVANAARMPFIAVAASEFLSKWVGEGENKLREMFAAARRYAPSTIFIDEIDCIAADRMSGAGDARHTDGLTNALLAELDGFGTQDAAPVFVIAATNFDTHGENTRLDRAFLRRFDKKIHISMPTAAERERFILRELAKYDFCSVSSGMAASMAVRSVGWSLADLDLVIQNAVRHSESGGEFSLTDGVLEEAFSSFNAGDKKVYDESTVRKTAYHEAGHAVAAVLLGMQPSFTTIAARGNYGGYMQYSDEDKFDLSRRECLNRICVAMAGRASEVCFYGEDGVTTGAGGDMRSATDMAVRMICSYGMEEDMLFFIEGGKAAEDAAVRRRVRDMLVEQYGRALQLIRENADKADAVAKALISRESLTGEELTKIISAI